MAKKCGNNTIILERPVYIANTACIVGQKEKEGPLGEYFDRYEEDDFNMDTWEQAEARFVEETYRKLLSETAGIDESMVDCIFGGDLLNQCMASAEGLKKSGRPYLGLFGACSTMTESMLVGALTVDGGGADNVVCITSSHFCSAEKQFRFPLELGCQRAPSSQWTVTGSGAALLSAVGDGPRITAVTPGIICDYNVTDTNNMGAGMAPAAASTIMAHLEDTGRDIGYYDMVVTGDLGSIGHALCKDILKLHDVNVNDGNYKDCGMMIFKSEQETCAGGSGCGCCASVFSAYLYKLLKEKKLNKILLVATGALMSPVTVKQGEAILGIAHAVAIEN
jgi:stage V sporulation protein AD